MRDDTEEELLVNPGRLMPVLNIQTKMGEQRGTVSNYQQLGMC